MPRTMGLGHGIGLGLGILLAGCGAPLPAAVSEAPAEAPLARTAGSPEIVPAVHADSATPREATASVVIAFQNPRTSFSSDKIDLETGKTLPIDDGMGPEGDISFFYDGTRFQAIANAGGGANRTIAPAQAGKPLTEFAMGPIPLQEGSEVLIKQDHGVFTVRITGLRAGSMTFTPDGLGTGTGSVSFTYQMQNPGTIARI